jgi:hypothetical protein
VQGLQIRIPYSITYCTRISIRLISHNIALSVLKCIEQGVKRGKTYPAYPFNPCAEDKGLLSCVPYLVIFQCVHKAY